MGTIISNYRALIAHEGATRRAVRQLAPALESIGFFCYADAMKFASILGLMVVGVALTLAGDVFLKRSDGWSSPKYLALGLLFYLLGCLPVAFMFKEMQFANVFIIWEAMTIALAMLLGYSIFGEPITRNKAIALLLTIAAVVLTYK
jgi:multidrug transporter EmrE-like cation transporter